MEYSLKAELGGKTLSIQTGKLAKQASGSVVVQYGETIVLVTVVSAAKAKSIDFLPLSVEYMEKIYAAGRIPGNYFRREIGRPSEKETLTARLIDRPIRPLFPEGYNFETQIIATVLSTDKKDDPDVIAMVGASAALEISDIPFNGPIACVRVGRIDGELRINPEIDEYSKCDINIIVAGSKTGIVMVEGESNIVSEADMLEAIYFGHEKMQPVLELQDKLKDIAGVCKRSFISPEKDMVLFEKIEQIVTSKIMEAIVIPDKMARSKALSIIKEEAIENLGSEYEERRDEVSGIYSEIKKKISRNLILKQNIRIDKRAFDEVRPISCETSILPRTHGSALFTRGETQVLCILTLGSGKSEQRIDSLVGEEFKSFMLHYNFPPFSVGEVKRVGSPSRRDIGHGTLALRALDKVLPEKEDFDYTIRIVSEVLESNGSSSMATVCAGCMSLMDGGVPIKAPVAGIAMGLVKEDDKVVILTDILGDEDHTGDMDFKVAGTMEGITALQMDIKISELSKDLLKTALEQAKSGRVHILEKMTDVKKVPNKDISLYAPKVYSVEVKKDKIRDIIGPGGKVIRALQSETNAQIDIDDSGIVKIFAENSIDGENALERIMDIVSEPEVGSVFEGTVVKNMDFGAFVEIKPGVEGLVHISQLANYHVKKVSDVVKEGDKIQVKIIEVTRDGKIRLSHKVLLDNKTK